MAYVLSPHKYCLNVLRQLPDVPRESAEPFESRPSFFPFSVPVALSPCVSSSLELGYHGCPVAPPHQGLPPLHQRHVTVPTSVPQQQVFALAEPKRKPSLFWHTFHKLTPFKK